MVLEAPFPYFGGKSKIADEVWRRFGDVPNYVEPFFGSGAVLLRRPAWHTGHIETVNDKDGYVSNFWRAVKHDPQKTAEYADYPVIENDLHARQYWLVQRKDELAAKLEGNPDWYDPKIAGWWAWGMSCWIGRGFCRGKGSWVSENGLMVKAGKGQGVNRQLPHMSGSRGINRQLPQLRNLGEGVNRPTQPLYEWFDRLSGRFKDVRVCCGDWSRIVTPSPTFVLGLTGIFLDPPYDDYESMYTTGGNAVSAEVRAWAIEAGKNPLMRIALCGYDTEHPMPDDWAVYRWKSGGGYGNQGEGQGRENSKRETIWFSPSCLKHEQLSITAFTDLG